jgi:hypothetical protein
MLPAASLTIERTGENSIIPIRIHPRLFASARTCGNAARAADNNS